MATAMPWLEGPKERVFWVGPALVLSIKERVAQERSTGTRQGMGGPPVPTCLLSAREPAAVAFVAGSYCGRVHQRPLKASRRDGRRRGTLERPAYSAGDSQPPGL
ncbi:hypothetical protein MRX96_030938 [Rhipicephalus microplus]